MASNELLTSFRDKKRILTICKKKDSETILVAINFIFSNNSLSVIEFNSYKYGITKYSILECKFKGNVWESEEDAKDISNLNYHYTSIGLNGTANSETNNKIYLSVLEAINDSQLKELIENAIISQKKIDKAILTYFNLND